jgi:hypothetical protein
MKKLIEQCKDHDYLFLKRESVSLTEPTLRIITKEIYACAYCGTGLDFYNLDEPVEVSE